MFINFENVQTAPTRKRLPFGIAQHRASRSATRSCWASSSSSAPASSSRWRWSFSVTPEDSARLAYVLEEGTPPAKPGTAEIGISPGAASGSRRSMRRRSMSHYSESTTSDIEVPLPLGLGRAGGDRATAGDFDLKPSMPKHSGKSPGRTSTPIVTSTSSRTWSSQRSAVDRIMLDACSADAYADRDARRDGRRQRTVLALRARGWRRSEVAVLPLSRNEKLVSDLATAASGRTWCGRGWTKPVRRRPVDRSPLSSPGRDRDAALPSRSTSRAIDDDAVTIRDRDTMEQIRVPIAELPDALNRDHLEELISPPRTVKHVRDRMSEPDTRRPKRRLHPHLRRPP